MESYFTYFILSIDVFTVIFFISFAIIALATKAPRRQKKDLEYILGRAFSGSAIPTGLGLLICSFYPKLLSELDDVRLNVAVAGIALLYISAKSMSIIK